MVKVHVRSVDDSFVIDPNSSPNDNVQTDTGFFSELAHQVATIIGPGYQWFTGSLPATLVSLAAHVATGSTAHGGFMAFVQQGGVLRNQRDTVNFTGGGVSVSDDSSNGRTQVNIPAAGPSSLTIQDEGTSDVTGYTKLNFTGPTVSVVDDGSNARANIVISGQPGNGTVISDSAATNAIIPFICTSTTRPSSPKTLFIIFETDTQNLLYNSGTSLSPVWSAISWQRVGVNGGSPTSVRPSLNVISDAIAVADNPTTNATDVTLSPSPSKLTTADFAGDYVVSGFLPTPGAITSVPPGTAYVGGIRINAISSMAVTLGPSSDNYVDLSSSGTLTVTSLSPGSTEPSVASNSLRLFAGTTDSLSVVSTVIDKRVQRPVVRGHDHVIADLPVSGVVPGVYDSPRVTVNNKGLVTGIIGGADVILTPASSTALGGSFLSVDMPSGQEATPYVVARHDPVFETRIEGLTVRWDSGTGFSVLPGAAWIQSLGKVYNVPNTITKSSLTGLTASTWYYAYIFDNGGTPDAELVTTAPSVAYKGDARSKSTDTARRFLIAMKTNASGGISAFWHRADGWVQYLDNTNVAPFQVATTATNTVTDIDCTAVVPSYSRSALLVIDNESGNYQRLGDGNRTYTLTLTAHSHMVANNTVNAVIVQLSSSQRYGIISGGSGSSVLQNITAFHNPR